MPSVVCVFYFCDFKYEYYEGKCEFMIAETIKFCFFDTNYLQLVLGICFPFAEPYSEFYEYLRIGPRCIFK